jgi:uncharacterized membrane protein
MTEFFEHAVNIVEFAAVVLLLVGLAISVGRYLIAVAQKKGKAAYLDFRQNLGRTLLLTLEFLIAADILETVVIKRSLESLGILAGLVVVRTFLSFALDVELEGRWPWQAKLDSGSKDESGSRDNAKTNI